MRWLRENVTTDGVVTTSDTWLVHQLCGAFVTDTSTASRSLLTGLDDVTWNSELLDLFGLAAEPLPAIVPNDAIVGTTRVFGSELPVTGLIVDQQAALLGEACIQAGDRKVHLRHRRVPARLHRHHPGPVHRRADHLGRLAAARPDQLLRRRAGLHRRLRGPLDHPARPDHRRGPARYHRRPVQ